MTPAYPSYSLLDQRCLNHPEREAVVRCPECRRFFCRECVTEHRGLMMCNACVEKAAHARDEKKGAGWRWAPLAAAGLLLAWLTFYYLGMALARMPATFHGESQ